MSHIRDADTGLHLAHEAEALALNTSDHAKAAAPTPCSLANWQTAHGKFSSTPLPCMARKNPQPRTQTRDAVMCNHSLYNVVDHDSGAGLLNSVAATQCGMRQMADVHTIDSAVQHGTLGAASIAAVRATVPVVPDGATLEV